MPNDLEHAMPGQCVCLLSLRANYARTRQRMHPKIPPLECYAKLNGRIQTMRKMSFC